MPVHIKFAGLRRRTLRSYGMALERFLHFVDTEGLEVKTTKPSEIGKEFTDQNALFLCLGPL